MAPRSLWKGQIRLSLVSIPVELFSATRTAGRTRFRQIHEPSGKRVHYEKVVQGIGPVDTDDIVKGYELDDGKYVLLEPEEIDAVKLETKRVMDLVQFVDACEIPPLYYDKPYYLVPTGDVAEEAYQVIRDALRDTGKVGLGQLTMRGREYLAAVRPCGNGLLLETLHYEDELRDAEPTFKGIPKRKSDADLLDVATALIDRKSGPFDASAFKDHYEAALKELIKKKKRGKKIEIEEEDDEATAGGDNVVDLMAALKKSLGDNGKKSGAKTSSSSRSSSSRKKKSA
ncbi:Ku protein [Pseudohoeflea suaedae]|uniref:Non-homologous end joining protein Ku n=1 Tax=Pseudohoeflea suaedae TaxID=877384 RepID=A0A4R5PJY0_9HYPH|nr:Ku protein [Pseudohoeflea suaedae]TDH35120.1 Ku protein [Pseudohoeflea suaedae]